MKTAILLLAAILSSVTSHVDGVPVASDIPGMSVTHIHVDRVPHDESTDIHYSDFHLFLTLDNQTGEDIQIVWAKVCFTIAKDPVCKEIQVSRDWEKGGWESKGHEWWTGQMPTEVELLRVGTSRAKGD